LHINEHHVTQLLQRGSDFVTKNAKTKLATGRWASRYNYITYMWLQDD